MTEKIDHVREAARAHSTLTTFASVVSILEGGAVYLPESDEVAALIIDISKDEQQRCLALYDQHRAAIAKAKGEGE